MNYTDRALGTIRESEELGGAFTEVVLQAAVGIMDKSPMDKAEELHKIGDSDFSEIANFLTFDRYLLV